MSAPLSRFTDVHLCGIDAVPGTIVGPCAPDVLASGLPAARFGDLCLCTSAHPARIIEGALHVLINGRPAARVGVATTHRGSLTGGDPSVLVGGATAWLPPDYAMADSGEIQKI